MCYRFANSGVNIVEALENIKAENQRLEFEQSADVNAFTKPIVPIVVEKDGRKLETAIWKLNEPKDGEPATKGLNLQAENSHTYYKKIEHNRCVIPINAFYEWKHYPTDKKDITALHRLSWNKSEQFYLAGYFNEWNDGTLGFGLVTGPANELLTDVHNVVYKDPKRKMGRMPISFTSDMAIKFLEDRPIEEFLFPIYNPQLIAENLEPHKVPQPGLF